MKNMGSWTIQDDGALLHRTCDTGVKRIGKREVCVTCLTVVPKVVNQLADELSQVNGEVNMTVNETLEPTTETEIETEIEVIDAEIEAEAAYQAGDLEEENEAEAFEDVPEVVEETPDGEINVIHGRVKSLIR